MTNNSEKAFKKQIFQAVYEDNVELQRFKLGAGKTPEPVPSETEGTGALYRLSCVLSLVFALGIVLVADPSLRFIPKAVAGIILKQEKRFVVKISPLIVAEGSFAQPIQSPVPLFLSPGQDLKPSAGELLFAESLLGLVNNQLPLARLFDLQVHTIVIDPGHGGRDPGTVGPRTGLTEKKITLDVARALKKKLEKSGRFRVLLTRNSDETLSLKDRVEFSREQQADLFVSIHVNSLPNESDNLVETFFFGAQDDERVSRLAEKENLGSEYALRDFSEMIKVLGDTLKTQESRYLAESVQGNLFTNMNALNTRIQDAGIKTAPFIVLLGVEVPAILIEISCVSNNKEEERLAQESYRQDIADYLELGIREYLERRASESTIAKGVW